MSSKEHQYVANDRIRTLVLPGQINVLMLLHNKKGYASFDEIFQKVDYRFHSKSHLLNCLREELIHGLIEKRVEKNASYYKITSKGKSVIEKSNELAKILDS